MRTTRKKTQTRQRQNTDETTIERRWTQNTEAEKADGDFYLHTTPTPISAGVARSTKPRSHQFRLFVSLCVAVFPHVLRFIEHI